MHQLLSNCPELNPTERLWQHTRKNGTHNRYFVDQQELVGTLTRVFHEIQTPPAQREHKRLHLGTVMKSPDMNKIFTFIAFRDEDQRYQPTAGRIPTRTRLGHPSSNTANWSIRLPGDKRAYGSFREIIGGR